jgi:pimeloyl-ACP methyl ester carboxylesterase
MKSSSRRRRQLNIGLAALCIVGLLGLVIVLFQDRLIYYPYRYAPAVWQQLPLNFEPLRYRTSQGAQVSFYRRPAAGGAPLRIWLICNGQGNYALEWADLLPQVGDRDAGFLLLDYPGYGFCEGACTPGRILAASEGAVEALRIKLGLPQDQLATRLGVFGYSLGTAPALHYAARHPVRRVVVVAPFTSLVDMGNAMFFWPCGQLIWHRFDNVARLAEISRQNPRPAVLIVHGDQDTDIPATMSEKLAAPYSGWVQRNVVAGADHETVLNEALRMLGNL